jgi:SpoIID/LytB domain
MKEPEVSVGIMFEPEIEFNLNTSFVCNGSNYEGSERVAYLNGKILWGGGAYDYLLFEPLDKESASFELIGVTIGINFHWERKENQSFRGSLKFIIEQEKLTAINILGVEEYMTSVISSEMSATASLELLKAHAVISRSWLLAQIEKNREIVAANKKYSAMVETEDELIRWYDREDHINFDICADDHCQRYQGITRASTEIVKRAIEQTRGVLIVFDGKICDARYSKCCGGVFEEFQNCWEDIRYPYLIAKRDIGQSVLNTREVQPDMDKLQVGAEDWPIGADRPQIPDLTKEETARKWILSSPDSFCNTSDKGILSQVLNNYDQETLNFYRWQIKYTQSEISDLINRRSGVDYGNIKALIPIERGTSGRLVKLKIVGTKRTKVIGKELEIRRTLSESHLYSSAFIVEKGIERGGVPESFTLTGAGWGHGVGLCQIGAAVMGEKGYKYDEILLHYFDGAILEKRY